LAGGGNMSQFQHRGMTLIELVITMAISAIIMLALNSLVKLGFEAQTAGRGRNELLYQGHFALERMIEKARSLTPKVLTTPTANTTGDWFSPSSCSGAACLMYCRNASNQLIETVNTDISCSGTTVVANNVSTLLASLPANMGAVDKPIVIISLTLNDANNNTASYSAYIRLGGGTL
jgi:prepilin-type N-terminal cleavage/methylation domain-containing protein